MSVPHSPAPQPTTIEIAGARLALRRAGNGDPLLFLHGMDGDAWPGALALLAQHFAVASPDHPGFGASDTPEWFETIHDVAYAHLSLLKALDLRGVHVVGADLGGWIAMEMAVRDTSRLASLTLVGSHGIHLKGVAKPDIFLWTEAEAARAQLHDPALGEAAVAALAAADDRAIDTRLKNRFAAARLMWSPRGFDPHLAKWLHRIDVPTLVAWGAEDAVLPVAYADALATLIPGARREIFPGCGHQPQAEQPAAFAAALRRFIDGTRA